jgi:glycerol-1-phosphate dehydrogenase [NAD(P)+]
MAPVFVEGVKRTLPSRYPDALICDLETVRDAPYSMTAAGVGDLLAAFVSLADWRLAAGMGMAPEFTTLPDELMRDLEPALQEGAFQIRERTPEGMCRLAKLIALAGLACRWQRPPRRFPGTSTSSRICSA